jgi:MurNAc alpha-1-phosphate uridylyltransferase
LKTGVKAMIFAAGVGERMRPLTDTTPKPLLRVGGVSLIEYHLRALAAAGVGEVVINVSHLAQQIIEFCDDGGRWGLSIAYSPEEMPLETAGGILQALPLLGDEPFIIVNGDVWCDFDFARLLRRPLRPRELARLVMVDNPPQHPQGDFVLDDDGWVKVRPQDTSGYTYAGIGLYSPRIVAGLKPGKLALRPLMDRAIVDGRLGGEYYSGQWEDVGTPQRLADLDARLTAS